MGIRTSIGLTSYRLEDFGPDERDSLESWRGSRCERPHFIDPDMINGFTCYLLGRAEQAAPTDQRFFPLREQIAASACVFRASDGKELMVLDGDVESIVFKRLAEFDEEDHGDLRLLGLPFSQAVASVGEDGQLAEDVFASLSAWGKTADAFDEFLAKPRRSTRFGLDDMLRSIDGLHALVDMLELFRRLLLAAGRAIDELGAATIDHYDLPGLVSSVGIWRVAQGGSARRIGSALSKLALRTEGIDVAEQLPERASADGSWILPYSRFGQYVTKWAMEHSESELNFAALGAAWPGPAVYGYDDGEEEPGPACELLAELSRRGKGPRDIPFGTDEVIVAEDLTVAVPPRFLGNDRAVYVARQFDEHGGCLRCVGESRRMNLLAKLIDDEQKLEGYAWGYIGEGAPGDVPDGFSAGFDEEFALLSIEGDLVELDGRGRLPLTGTGLDGLMPGASLVIEGNGETFFIAESCQAEAGRALDNV